MTSTAEHAPDLVWYVAYGSNLSTSRFLRYFNTGEPFVAAEPIRVSLPASLYFAGESRVWGGSPAFVTLNGAGSSHGCARLLTLAQLHHLAEGENGASVALESVDPLAVLAGDWTKLGLGPEAVGHRGKYDAMLRLPDLHGLPAVTLTTSRALAPGEPAEGYTATIVAGLIETVGLSENSAVRYLSRAIQDNLQPSPAA